MASQYPPVAFTELFDEDGFMLKPCLWDESLAESIALDDGIINLTQAHWNIIRTLRAHYYEYGEALPAFRHVCYINKMGKYCVDNLFHSQREAWRIAGLPNPGEEAKSYM